MKYARTKDGRIVSFPNKAQLILYDNEKLIVDTTKTGHTCVYGIVDKVEDTIEELCDEFVVYVKDNKLLTNLGSFESCYNWYIELKNRKGVSKVDVSMFGAIWTDKGLIYVAKMNEKGELELL